MENLIIAFIGFCTGFIFGFIGVPIYSLYVMLKEARKKDELNRLKSEHFKQVEEIVKAIEMQTTKK